MSAAVRLAKSRPVNSHGGSETCSLFRPQAGPSICSMSKVFTWRVPDADGPEAMVPGTAIEEAAAKLDLRSSRPVPAAAGAAHTHTPAGKWKSLVHGQQRSRESNRYQSN